jgi:PAS domain S-box-containing protein
MGKPKLLTVLSVSFGLLLIGVTTILLFTYFQRQQVLYGKVDHVLYEMQNVINSKEQRQKSALDMQEIRHIRKTQDRQIFVLAVGLTLILLLSFEAIMFVMAKRPADGDRTLVQLAVTQALTESKNFGTGALRLLSSIAEIYGFTFGAIWLIDEERGLIRPHTLWASSSLKDQTFIEATRKFAFKKGVGLPGRVWQQGKPIWISDVVVDNNYPRAKAALQSGLHAALAFPILLEDKIIGQVEFYFPKVLPRQKGLLILLPTFGHAIGAFLERMDLKERLTEEARIATFAALVGQVVSSESKLTDMLEECAKLTTEHLGIAFCGVWTAEKGARFFEQKGKSGDASSLPDMSRLSLDQETIESLKVSEQKFARNGHIILKIAYKQAGVPQKFVPLLIAPLLVGTELVGFIGVMQETQFSKKATPELSIACKNVALGIARCQIEAELEANDRQFTEITTNLEEMVWVTQPGGFALKWVSTALARFFHRTPEQLIQEPIITVEGIHESDRAAAFRFFKNSAAGPASIEYRQLDAAGKWHWLWCRSYPSFDESGRLAEVYGIAIDITSKKEAEKNVHEFYSMVSHELRTPLTSVHASLRIMEGGLVGPLNDKVKKLVTIARTESDRLIRLINDILDIRKLEAGMLELKLTEVDIVKLIELSLAEMKGLADNAGITLVSDIKWSGVFDADQDRTMQMLDNLLSNAIKFSPSGAEVRVTVEKVEDNIRLTVSDNGPGIAKEEQSKLFCKFQQLDSSDSRPQGGTGLGLAITKAIAEQHGGAIGLESELGKGSSFWIELPLKARPALTRPSATDHLTEGLNEGPTEAIAPSQQRCNVLLIEKDIDYANKLISHLGKAGFDLTIKDTFEAADDFIRANNPAVVLADVDGLPDWVKWLGRHSTDVLGPKYIVLADTDSYRKYRKNTANTIWHEKPFGKTKIRAALEFASASTYAQRLMT